MAGSPPASSSRCTAASPPAAVLPRKRSAACTSDFDFARRHSATARGKRAGALAARGPSAEGSDTTSEIAHMASSADTLSASKGTSGASPSNRASRGKNALDTAKGGRSLPTTMPRTTKPYTLSKCSGVCAGPITARHSAGAVFWARTASRSACGKGLTWECVKTKKREQG